MNMIRVLIKLLKARSAAHLEVLAHLIMVHTFEPRLGLLDSSVIGTECL